MHVVTMFVESYHQRKPMEASVRTRSEAMELAREHVGSWDQWPGEDAFVLIESDTDLPDGIAKLDENGKFFFQPDGPPMTWG